MRRSTKIWLGIATGWPFAYFLLFFLFVISMFALIPGDGGEMGVVSGIFLISVIVLHVLTILLILGLQIFYIVNAGKTERFSQGEKIAWIVALFFGGIIAMPIYWYLNLWKREEEDESEYKGLGSGFDFESASSEAAHDRREEQNVPRKPHNWR